MRRPFLRTTLEDVCVRSRAHHRDDVILDLVDQQPIRFKMYIPMVLPIAPKRMVLIADRKYLFLRKKIKRFT